MKRCNYDDKCKIDDFVGCFISETERIEKLVAFLKVDKEDAELIKRGFDLIKRKTRKMKKSRSIEEIDEYLKVDKVIKDRKD